MSERPSRFRIAQVTAPATPAERLERHLDDGSRLAEVAAEVFEPLVRELRVDELLDALAVVRRAPDAARVYQIHKLAAAMLTSAAAQRPGQKGDFTWAGWYDAVPAVLVPLLEETPSEPELLNLLGVAWFELGETPLARRLFEAIKEIEPLHQQARENLRGCKERAKRGVGVPKPPDEHTRRSRPLHADCKRIAERATKLSDHTISLVMIVKDEEEMLPGCLEPVAAHVDQIVVVDTGSTDRTREIAAEHGAQVVEFPWNGSFSDARNRGLQEATGDWVLWLDADEHMEPADAPKLHELARKTWVEGFYLVETHFTGQYEVGMQSSHMAMRLFQRRPQTAWKGIVHEQIMHNMPTYLAERFQHSPVRISHYGYLENVVEDRAKRSRNLDLLEQQAAANPEDAFTQFNIGSEYGAMHDWPGARPYFERALELARRDPFWHEQQFAPMMVSRLCVSRRSTGDHPATIALIDEGLALWPDFTDLEFERALVLAERGDAAGARKAAERCLELGDAPARYVSQQGKGSHQARALLASVLVADGDVAGARVQLESAMEEAPHFLPVAMELADLLLQDGDPDEVQRTIDEQLGERAQGPTAAMMVGSSFHEAGHLEHAENYYERVLAAVPDHAGALLAMAELRLAQRRYGPAYDLAMRVSPLEPMAVRAARTAFLAGVVHEEQSWLREPLRIINEAEHVPAGQRAVHTAWHARLTGGSALLPPDPDAAVLILQNLEALARLEATDEFAVLAPLLDQAMPDERERHMALGALYLRRRFADMAAEEYMAAVQQYGPDARALTGLGKVATIKEMWEDAEVFLSESLQLDPEQEEARRLLELIRQRAANAPVG